MVPGKSFAGLAFGKIIRLTETTAARITLLLAVEPHSAEIAGFHDTPCGDKRFLNNLFDNGHGLSPDDGFETREIRLPVLLAAPTKVPLVCKSGRKK